MAPLPVILLSSLAASSLWTDTVDALTTTNPNRNPKAQSFQLSRRSIPSPSHSLRRRQTTPNTVTAPLDNLSIAYTINLAIGTPPQPFTVQLDTGSSDLWIPARGSAICTTNPDGCDAAGSYDPSSSSSSALVAEGAFTSSYQDGTGVQGSYYNDTIVIGGSTAGPGADGSGDGTSTGTTIQGLTMGVATQSDRTLGVLGIGYDSGEAAVQLNADDDDDTASDGFQYPNLITQMYQQGLIASTAYSLWLNDLSCSSGSILFGGIDTSKYIRPLTALPIQSDSNASYSDFTVALTSLSFIDAKGHTPFSRTQLALPVILDSGTSFTFLPPDIANALADGLGTTDDPDLGRVLPCAYARSTAALTFTFGNVQGAVVRIPLKEFITPIDGDGGSGGDDDHAPHFPHTKTPICAFGLLPTASPSDPLILGDTFLRSAYVVYDLRNNVVALAQTKTGGGDAADIQEITQEDGIPDVASTASGIAVTQTYTGIPLATAATTVSGLGAEGTAAAGVGKPSFELGVSVTGSAASIMSRASPVGWAFGTVGLVLLSVVEGGMW